MISTHFVFVCNQKTHFVPFLMFEAISPCQFFLLCLTYSCLIKMALQMYILPLLIVFSRSYLRVGVSPHSNFSAGCRDSMFHFLLIITLSFGPWGDGVSLLCCQHLKLPCIGNEINVIGIYTLYYREIPIRQYLKVHNPITNRETSYFGYNSS